MDLSMARLGPGTDTMGPQLQYPAFAAPTPIHPGKGYTANTLTPGSLPSPLNFPSITPPSSPYSFYGLYSPVTSGPKVSPLYDPSYLTRLKSNPLFRDLQSVLLQECLQMEVPANLITTSWNLMHLHKASGSSQAPPTNCPSANHSSTGSGQAPSNSCQAANQTSGGSGQKVYNRHMQLQDKLLKVRIDSAISADGLTVENEYSKEVGSIEMNRYRALHTCLNVNVKATINSYHDRERLQLADKTEEKLDSLIVKADKMRQAALKANCERSSIAVPSMCDSDQGKLAMQDPSAQGASLLLHSVEDADAKLTAVRKLKFNISDETAEEEDEENDYLNGSVNSEDFEIDEIDVETVESRATTPVEFENPKSNSSDLLQQCIEESGLSAIAETDTVSSTSNGDSGYRAVHSLETSGSVLAPYSSMARSPDSLPASVPALSTPSHPLPSPAGQHTTMSTDFNHCPVKHDQSAFQTPHGLKFQHPDQISMALSEIGQLCGGPSVTFTPEMRREVIPSATPDAPGFSPFGFSASMPMTTQSHHTWKSHPDMNGNYRNRTGSGQKRKSPCPDTEETNHVTTQQDLSGLSHQTVTDSNGNQKVSSAGDTCDTLLNNNPQFKVHRMLSAEATNILTCWYTDHVQYPYPSDVEVKQLSQLTGITGRQVKKWMANKRVRCFNTLSITGNQHPIKFKYGGTGRTKKSKAEKENCDSTTNDKKPNYTLLSDEAKQRLNCWYEAHLDNPYPTEEEKQQLAATCSITVGQVKSWFANKRNRTNNTKRQVPNYFINRFPEYSNLVQFVGQKREEARMIKRRKLNDVNMYIQPNFYF